MKKKPSIRGCGYYDVCERRDKRALWITRGCSNLNNETSFDSKSKSCRDPRVATCEGSKEFNNT
jgi:hypothetical protein